MIRLAILGIVIIGAMFAWTNPSFEDHKKAFYASTAAEATKSEMLVKIAADVLSGMDVLPLSYNNYFLFSTTTMNNEPVSFGILSRVWKLDRDAPAAEPTGKKESPIKILQNNPARGNKIINALVETTATDYRQTFSCPQQHRHLAENIFSLLNAKIRKIENTKKKWYWLNKNRFVISCFRPFVINNP